MYSVRRTGSDLVAPHKETSSSAQQGMGNKDMRVINSPAEVR